jgi:hexosaminidase
MPMKYLLSLFAAAILLVACSVEPPGPIHVVPKPVTVKPGTKTLAVEQELNIVASAEDEKNVASLLQGYLKGVAIEASVSEQPSPDKTNLLLKTETGSGKESYSLAVNGDGIEIKASDGAGLFYGAQTFMQLVSPDKTGVINYPYVEINDAPRFPYRGLHLDVGRHMFPIEFIKKYIDLMARHKYNRFHWHLTEDQGWRIEIKKYPRLQEVAAYRNQTVIGKASTRNRPTDPGRYDKTRYGGFYTQEEVKEVVAYAAQRYITVVPEIELPGHALAALTAYPNLGCTGGPYKVAETWGVFDDVFCAGKEDAFLFLQDVFDEIIPLFPGEYIHVGGDECPKAEWKKCPHCQKRIKTEKLKDEHELQSYFIQRMEKYLNSKGKKIIGWDEILEGGLAPGATVMSWRGEEGGIEAAKQNHDVIMTPTKWCYFDYYQDSLKSDPLATGLYLPVKQVYSYEPEPPQLKAEEAKHILGVQANVWTEFIKDTAYLEYMVYPRACAMAEVAWSAKGTRDYNDFLIRMSTHMKRLDAWNVNYAKHIANEIPTGSK